MVHSDLGKVIREIIDEFRHNPPLILTVTSTQWVIFWSIVFIIIAIPRCIDLLPKFLVNSNLAFCMGLSSLIRYSLYLLELVIKYTCGFLRFLILVCLLLIVWHYIIVYIIVIYLYAVHQYLWMKISMPTPVIYDIFKLEFRYVCCVSAYTSHATCHCKPIRKW